MFWFIFWKIDEFINPSNPSKNKLSSRIINNLPQIEIFSKEISQEKQVQKIDLNFVF